MSRNKASEFFVRKEVTQTKTFLKCDCGNLMPYKGFYHDDYKCRECGAQWRLDDNDFSKVGGCAQYALGKYRHDRNTCGRESISEPNEHGYHYQICLIHAQIEYQKRLERFNEMRDSLEEDVKTYGQRVKEQPLCPDCGDALKDMGWDCSCPDSREEEEE